MGTPLKLAPNRAYPSIPTVAGTLENHTLVLEAMREALAIHERRTGNAGDSFVRLSELEETGVITIDQTTNIVVAPDDDGLFIRRDGLSPATTGEIDFGAGIWMRPDTAIKWGNTEYLLFQSGLTTGVSGPGGVVIPTSHIMAYVDFEDGVGGNPGTGSDAYVNGLDGSGQGGTYTGSLTDTDTPYGTYCAISTQGNFADTSIRIDEAVPGDSNVETAVAAGIPYHIEFRWKPSELAGGNWILQTMDNFAQRNLAIIYSNGNLSAKIGNTTSAITEAVSVNTSTWYHVAITLDTLGVFRLWLDGTLVGSPYDATSQTWDSNGDPTSWDFMGFHEGRVDNILVLRGTALYGAAEQSGGFTPPTIITPAGLADTFIVGDPASVTHIDGSLIELENSVGINWDDGTGTNVELLVLDTASVVVNGIPPAAISAKLTFTQSVPGFMSTYNEVVDESGYGHAITYGATAEADDGTLVAISPREPGDFFFAAKNLANSWVELAPSSTFDLGTGDFCIEIWAYRPTSGNPNINSGLLATGNTGWRVWWMSHSQGGDLRLQLNDVDVLSVEVATWTADGVWNHIAFVRSGTTITLYFNGVARGSTTSSADFTSAGGAMIVGEGTYNYALVSYMPLDDFRLTKGYPRYTQDFTPPSVGYTEDQETQFIVGDPNYITHIDGSLIELVNGVGINWDDGTGVNVEALVFGPAPIVVGAPLTNLYTTIEPDALPTIETMTVTVNVWVDLNTVANRSAAMVDVSQLTNGEEYFIMVHSLAGNSLASTGGDHLRLLDQSGSPLPSSEGRWSRFTNYGFEWSYYFKAVVDSAGNDFLTQQKSQRTSTRNMGYWDMAIPVGNLPASRWLYSESVSTQVFGQNPTALAASITIDTAGDYWIFVNATLDGADPNAQSDAGYVIQVYDGTTEYGLSQDNVEIITGPLAEQYIFGAWLFLENVQAGTVLTPRMYYEPFKGISNPSVSRSMIAGLNVSEHFVEHYAVTDYNLAFYSAGTTTHSTDNFTVQNSGVMSFFGHAQITESGTAYIEAQKNGGGYTKYSESHRRDSAIGNLAQAQRVTPLEGAAGQLSVTAGDVIDVRFITTDGGSGQLGSHSIFSIMMETVDALGNTCVLGDPSYPTRIDGNTTTVTGAAQLDSTLSVTGATTLASTLNVTGATTLASTLDVTGATTLASTLDVTGLATFDGGILGNTPVADTTTPILTLATDVINVDRRLISFLEAGGTEGFYLQADWSEGSPGNWLEFGSTYPLTAGIQIFAIKEDGAFRFDNGLIEYTPGVTLDKGTLTHLGVTTFEIGNTTTANDITRLDVMCLSAAKSMVGLFEDGKGTGVSLLYDGTTNTGYLRGHNADTTGVDILEFPRTSDLLNVFGGEFVLSSQTTEPTFQHFNVAATANLAQTFNADIDYDWTFTGVTDWNITGLTSIQAGTVDADFDAITATSYGGIVEANLLDLAAAETVTGNWVFSGTLTIPQAAVTAHEAALTILESQITDGAILARVAGTETITGAWTFSDELLALSFGEDSSSPASATNAITFDLANGAAFEVTLTENITSITISNPPTTGYHAVMTVKFIQDATGSWTVGGWPAAVKWVGGAAPTITGTATTGTDIVRLETWDAGTTWYGTYDQNFS